MTDPSYIPRILAVVALALLITLWLFRAFIQRNVYPTLARASGNIFSVTMPALVTVIVLCSGLYIILDQSYSADDKKWGYGIVGTVVGYWLRR
jgi:hypothetical protein